MNSLKNCSNSYQVSVRPAIALPERYALYFIFLSFALFTACSPAHEEHSFSVKAKETNSPVNANDKNIVTDTINGITHNFIRKADIKCKVKDVLSETRQVEQIAARAGGYTTNSNLVSNLNYTTRIHFKKDSLNELTYYTLTSNITVRVPNKKLDSVLAKITDMAVYIDHRTITAEDVKLKLYANQLAETRYSKSSKRISKKEDAAGYKLKQVTEAEETMLQTQALADNAGVESYDLADQVNYSTIVLFLYQDQNSSSVVIAFPPSVKPYEPSFVYKLGESLLHGFEIITRFILFTLNYWGLFLILFIVYLLIIKVIRYSNRKNAVVHS